MNRFELNYAGVGQILKSEEMQNVLQAKAEEICGRCGEGYSTDVKVLNTRAVASVFPETDEAYIDNLKHNTLLKAVR